MGVTFLEGGGGMNTYAMRVGDLPPFYVKAKNRRSAINKTLEDPDQVAIIQTYATSATLFRVTGRRRTAERIGEIWEAKE